MKVIWFITIIFILYISLIVFLLIKNRNKDISASNDEYMDFVLYIEEYNKKKNTRKNDR